MLLVLLCLFEKKSIKFNGLGIFLIEESSYDILSGMVLVFKDLYLCDVC